MHMTSMYRRLRELVPPVSRAARRPRIRDTAVDRGEPLCARFHAHASVARSWRAVCLLQFPLLEPYVRYYRIRLSDGLSVKGIHEELTLLPSQVDQPCPLQGTVDTRPL